MSDTTNTPDIAATLAELDRLHAGTQTKPIREVHPDRLAYALEYAYPALRAHIATLTERLADAEDRIATENAARQEAHEATKHWEDRALKAEQRLAEAERERDAARAWCEAHEGTALASPAKPETKSSPNKRFGRECLGNSRIAVDDVRGWYAAGMTTEQILSDYPELTREQVEAFKP